MPARIFCKFGELAGVSARIGTEATLGRGRDATVQLQAGQISGQHLRIAYDFEEERYVLEDLGSTNGTALDGVRVRDRERLGHLHVITLAGEHDLIFQDLDLCAQRHGTTPPSEDTAIDDAFPVIPEHLAEPVAPPSEVEKTRIDELPAPMPDFLAGRADDLAAGPADEVPDDGAQVDGAQVDGAQVVAQVDGVPDDRTRIDALPAPMPDFLNRQAEEPAPEPAAPEPTPDPVSEDQLTELFLGDVDTSTGYGLEVRLAGDVEVFRLHEGENVVGRSALATLRIDDPEISRRHALLTVEAGRVSLRDLGSSNFTFLGNERVVDTVDVPLGATILLGDVEARLVPWDEEEGKPS